MLATWIGTIATCIGAVAAVAAFFQARQAKREVASLRVIVTSLQTNIATANQQITQLANSPLELLLGSGPISVSGGAGGHGGVAGGGGGGGGSALGAGGRGGDAG